MIRFGEKARMWVPPYEVESSALDQIKAVEALPEVVGIAVMPDVHAGVGATVGSVIAMRGAIAPAAVGVDIGCGMMATLTDLRVEDLGSLPGLRAGIEAAVPVGFNSHKRGLSNDSSAWADFKKLAPEVQDGEERARLQLGTLGGGNHFIEVCLDEQERVWVMLHSGSRNIGKRIADVYVAKAIGLPHNRGRGHLSTLIEGTPEFVAYWHDLQWAQVYAAHNRHLMMGLVRGVLTETVGREVRPMDIVACHHNYARAEQWDEQRLFVTRKGAISAAAGERGIIPGSMGQRSYIVRGAGNPDAYASASHGAGRRMSRGAAKRTFTVAELEAATAGVECRKDASVLDEIPGAYKSLDVVMEHQRDLVSVEHELRALLCVKG